MDFDSIFPPGFHDIDKDDIPDLFVNSFNNHTHREYLTERLFAYLDEFEKLGLSAEVWLDGSYTTYKPEPKDIDLLIICNQSEINKLPASMRPKIKELLDNSITSVRYSVHLLLAEEHDAVWRSYWRGWFGFSRDEKPKGIVRFYYGKL